MKRNVKWRSITAAPLILGCLLGLQADRPQIKIGTVNFRQLLVESPDLKAAMQALEAQYNPRRQELLKMQRDAKNHPNDQALQRDFDTQAAEFQDHASASRNDAVQKVVGSLVETIGTYARQQDLDLVIADKPLFVSPLLDKTATVLNVTTQVQAFIRHPTHSPAMPTVPTESPETKIGVIPGLNLAARTGEEIKRIKDYAREHGIEMVLDSWNRTESACSCAQCLSSDERLTKII
jgi:Skp family chaperone for outer membrane proteins